GAAYPVVTVETGNFLPPGTTNSWKNAAGNRRDLFFDCQEPRSLMSSYYLSEDLARFGEMGSAQPKLFDLFMKWYGSAMETGALDARTKKLIALAVAFSIQE